MCIRDSAYSPGQAALAPAPGACNRDNRPLHHQRHEGVVKPGRDVQALEHPADPVPADALKGFALIRKHGSWAR
eukprot:10766452-Alexandrium_andersonii.AAC.1